MINNGIINISEIMNAAAIFVPFVFDPLQMGQGPANSELGWRQSRQESPWQSGHQLILKGQNVTHFPHEAHLAGI
jgi:hypothetical protein